MEEKKSLDFTDFDWCNNLVWAIANKQFYNYSLRVSFTKLEKEDFYQNGWVALQDCINKGINDLNYVCVAIRNAMYRGVEKTALIQTSNKEDLWYYISGHENRMENKVYEDLDYGETFCSSESVEEESINKVLTQQVFSAMKEDDRKELYRIMMGLPAIKQKGRVLSKKRAFMVLNGEKPYKNERSVNQSDISGVTYDKSKDKWVFSKRINGKIKKFITNRDKSVVENFAKVYYEELKVSG